MKSKCEYLLRAFRLEFKDAARWLDAADQERWDFSPKKLRKIGGFDDKEYANHCNIGGHPNPAARPLLELPRKFTELNAAARGAKKLRLDQSETQRLDFAFHCDRSWRALAELLSQEHARFERVRARVIEEMRDARAEWHDVDGLGKHAGSLLSALEAEPTALLSDCANPDH